MVAFHPRIVIGTVALAALTSSAGCWVDHSSLRLAQPQLSPSTSSTTSERVRWPEVQSRVPKEPGLEARIQAILERMSLEEKVAQMIQPDILSVSLEDVQRYKFGSIFAEGNSAPGGNQQAAPAEWLKLADDLWQASNSAGWSGEAIPMLFGIDAVHGHTRVIGATIFPHNISLGATRNPGLIRQIAEITALEMVTTGIDWNFSPTLAVVRDDRWGRTFEGFSEDPRIIKEFAGQMVEGLQGTPLSLEFLRAGRVVATAKHFVGDGGTVGGKDRGDNRSSPQELRDMHGAGYPPAIEAGVQSIMASFNSIHGERVHGSQEVLTGALKEEMKFDGLVVGDWNGHGLVPGCTDTSCPQAANAGLDIFMAPDSWKGLYYNTLAQVRGGVIPLSRVDDAVRRILRVKLRAGLFEKGLPSSRPFAGRFNLLGSSEHRAVARQAVRESLVLLKNNGSLLPLSAGAHVLVAGDGADNIAKQSGGWTINWQTSNIVNAHFPNAQSIFSGIQEAVREGGGIATLSVDGSYDRKPDVAIVVFGEDPYAEWVGDRSTLEYSPADKKVLELLGKLRAHGIPTVAVFLSGRPMWVNPELNAADAFVAAFLPGGEGGGIADVLFGDTTGRVRYDFRGKLSYSWPNRADQTPLNVGDPDYSPLFPYDYGLTYADEVIIPHLPEDRPKTGADGQFFVRGSFPTNWGFTHSGGVSIRSTDRRSRGDARVVSFGGAQAQWLSLNAAKPIDLSRETNAQLSLVVDYRVDSAPTAPVRLGMGGYSIPITEVLRTASRGNWHSLAVPLGCFAQGDVDMERIAVPLALTTVGRLTVTVSDVRIAGAPVDQEQCSF